MNYPAIRFATLNDCPKILEIYSHYILTSAISFETEVPSESEFATRSKDVTSQFPWLIYEENSQILGYAYASTHRSRCAYDWSCEVSVYIDKNHHQKGIGTKLYKALFPILKEQGIYNLFAGATQPNEGSHKVHTNLGFTKIGTYRNIGFKFSKWHDVSWYQCEINAGGTPQKPVSPSGLFQNQVNLKPISPDNEEVQIFITSLDDYLNDLYPPEENHLDIPETFNHSENQIVGAFAGQLLVGIGAMKLFDVYGEIKRMWVPHLYRGFGISKKLLAYLEREINSNGRKVAKLETGSQQDEAIGLYRNFGYIETKPFGSYQKNKSSLFMEKEL